MLLLATGCTETLPTLIVDVKTDLSPAVEFDWIELELFRSSDTSGEPVRTAPDVNVDDIDDALAGVRVAELGEMSFGDWWVHVRLMRSGGGEVREAATGSRAVHLMSSPHVVTVLITRDCAGLTCPRDGDDPRYRVCLGGRCVDATCTPETPARCPTPECVTDGECMPSVGGGQCGVGLCLEGTCTTYLDPDRCRSAERCQPEGCVPRADAGVGTDAGLDGGPLDAGLGAAGSIVAGGEYTCGLGAGEVRCWGLNDRGQLGDGTTNPRLSPVGVVDLSDAVELAAGWQHTCARLSTGEVWCWGNNVYGQLGDGTSESPRPSAVAVMGLSDAVEITAGNHHTCARLGRGEVRCWGYNDFGQLGDGTNEPFRLSPVAVVGLSDPAELTAGQNHTCARLNSGDVRCWGSNSSGQLGDGTMRSSPRPVAVTGLANAVELTAGQSHTCARLASGEVGCWGWNGNGQLGDGMTEDAMSPVAVMGLSAPVELAAGGYHTCARERSSEVRCWGWNNEGQVGDGTRLSDRLRPVAVMDLSGAVELTAGWRHTCARLGPREARCWGANDSGQLGDGTSGMDRLVPVTVLGL